MERSPAAHDGPPALRGKQSRFEGTRPSLKSRRPTGRIFDAPTEATFPHFDRLGELAGRLRAAPTQIAAAMGMLPLPTLQGAN
jgi:hypothetical protein